MDSFPQVATQEISDSDLDNVSGGLIGGVVGTAVGTVDSIAPVSATVGTVAGTIASATGINPVAALSPATGLVAGL